MNNNTITVKEALHWSEKEFIRLGSSARRESLYILSAFLKKDRAWLLAYPEAIVYSSDLFCSWVQRRSKGEPLDNILGEKEFWGLPFLTSHNVLTPRTDSETLIEAVIQDNLCIKEGAKLLDLGTGSGCLLLSLLSEYPKLYGDGCDISVKAIGIAKANARHLGLDKRASFFISSWDTQLDHCKSYPIIISNPPYIPSKDIEKLAPEVKKYDPINALDGGGDGYQYYRVLAPVLKRRLAKKGRAYLELGIDQSLWASNFYKENGFKICALVKDLSGIKRVLVLEKTRE